MKTRSPKSVSWSRVFPRYTRDACEPQELLHAFIAGLRYWDVRESRTSDKKGVGGRSGREISHKTRHALSI